MLFSSSTFLFFFLPIVLVIYYISPSSFRNFIILIASLFFYAWGENILVIVMLCSLSVDYIAAILIDNNKRKLGLFLSISINLFFLGFFKYFNFFTEIIAGFLGIFGMPYEPSTVNISLPIGISFYTFQSMSYTIDVYNGYAKANRNFLQFATYVTMFPQLVAGPIVRYVDIQKQLINKNISSTNFHEGLKRFIQGLAKKMIIANPCGYIADHIFVLDTFDISTPVAWLGLIAYSFHIYYDFSGYSDMAIGLGKMLGFDFLENFNFPYIAKNVREFWRRWHISLSTWFRDYLYIPLGGSRKGNARTYYNLLLVFLITGLWHGASWNFVIWGLFHGLFMLIERLGFEKILSKLWQPLQHLYTLLVVGIAWVFFKADDLEHALNYISRLFTISVGNESLMDYTKFYCFNSESMVVLLLAILFSMPTGNWLHQKFLSLGEKLIIAKGVGLMILFVISISYVVNGSYNPFIYFRF